MIERSFIKILFVLFAVGKPMADLFGQEIFNTSICYDLLATVDKFDDIDSLDDFYSDTGLVGDSVFVSYAKFLNKNVRASNLCNLYSISDFNKNNILQCIEFFRMIEVEKMPAEYRGVWSDRIIEIKEILVYYLTALYDAGYEAYWRKNIEPKLSKSIEDYQISSTLLDSIHKEIDMLAGPEPLGKEYPKIYVLDIDNAFNLVDETFCTTSLLLNKEMAEKFRIDFIQVYIHENLHRLTISERTMWLLSELMKSDNFYRVNEEKARSKNEGRNEAFIVAAETFISYRLGLKSKSEVYSEFINYCDGTHVLAPIVYMYLEDKKQDESFDYFLNRLFDEGKISAGKVREQYNQAMEKIK